MSSLGTYVWEDGDGTSHDFTSTSGTRYEDLDNLGLILTILSSEYILTDKHGNKSVFDAEGRLSKQINNQSTASCITISYQSDTSTLISRITDGVGRKYDFTYRSGLLFQISYSGTQSVPLTNISFGYTNTNLTSITYKDSNTSLFSYTTKNQIASVTDTFSAYLKTNGGLTLRISDGSTTVTSDILDSSNEWTRREVTYTNTTPSAKNVTLQIFHLAPGTAYIDCVQLEANQSASRYNLIVDSEFSSLSGPWHTYSTGTSHPGTSGGNAPPGLVANRARISGDTNTQQYIYQDIAVSGNAGDRYVFSGWFTGNSLPDNNTNRFCGLRLTFKYTNGTTATTSISFTPNAASDKEWQYFAGSAEATDTYYAITFKVEYSYNANILLLDGMHLFKEAFGETYSYYPNGNLETVRDVLGRKTEYKYNGANDLTEILEPNGVKTVNSYDYHNLINSAKQYKVYDEETNATKWVTVETDVYTYDDYGNVTSYSSTANGTTKTTSADYNTTGNFLTSSTDSDGNTTSYYYDSERSYLSWVQYPEDTQDTRTYYEYDNNMFMLTRSYTTTDKNVPMSVNYTYSRDYLTCITTPSTAYTISYGSFGQRTKVSAGNYTLAEYRYSADTNHRLVQLDYGNGDVVKYSYNTQGRVIAEAYHENGSTSASRIVTYAYDSNGALASMTDSKTGVTTTYYYDTLGRSTGQKETGDITHSLRTQYNDKGLVAHVKEFFNQTSKDQYYTYDEYDRLIRVAQGLAIEDYAYDNLDRLTSSITKHGSANVLTTSTTYDDTSDRVASQTLTGPGLNRTYQYTYDSNGNITSVNDGSYITTYEYDSQNQLIRENNARNLKTWTWTYDSAGNITSKKEYYYTAGDLGAVYNETKYTYGDSTWKDKLTAFNNKPITYDAIGNPLSDGTWSYTWEQGRQLAKMSSSSNIWNFTYDANGMRTGRSNTGTTYTYVYNGSQLSRMTYGPHVLQFTYGADGAPQSVTYNNTWYYYVTNLQGDVVSILNSSGTPVVYYYYDAWGKLLETSDYSGNGLGMINPLRYRGYVYDRETGLYYLQSRYYNPTIGRFINADAQISGVGGDILGYNTFAYCMNNPVMGYDPTGCWDWGGVVAGLGIIAVTVIVVASCGVATPVAALVAGAAITTGITMTYAAATDSAMVVDLSGSILSPIPWTYGKGGASIIIDFGSDEANLYLHGGGGIGYSSGVSYSSGLLSNYENPQDYAKDFTDVSAGFDIGLDHCWTPQDGVTESTQATSVTFSSGLSFGVGYDYYSEPIKLFEW